MQEDSFPAERINSLLILLLHFYCPDDKKPDPTAQHRQQFGPTGDTSSQVAALEADFAAALADFVKAASRVTVRRLDWLDKGEDKVEEIAQECMVRLLQTARNCGFTEQILRPAYIYKVCLVVARATWIEYWKLKPGDVDDPTLQDRLSTTVGGQDNGNRQGWSPRGRALTEGFLSAETSGDHACYVRRRRSTVLLHMAFLTFGGRGYAGLAIGTSDLAVLLAVSPSTIADDQRALRLFYGFPADADLSPDIWSELTGVNSRLDMQTAAVATLVGWDSKTNRDYTRPHAAAIMLLRRCLDLLRDEGTTVRRELYSRRKGDPYVDDQLGNHHLFWSLEPSDFPSSDRLIMHGARY